MLIFCPEINILQDRTIVSTFEQTCNPPQYISEKCQADDSSYFSLFQFPCQLNTKSTEFSMLFYLRLAIKRSLSDDLIRCQGNKNDSESKYSDFVSTSLFIQRLLVIQLQRLLSFLVALDVGQSVSKTLLTISALLTAWFFSSSHKTQLCVRCKTKYRLILHLNIPNNKPCNIIRN